MITAPLQGTSPIGESTTIPVTRSIDTSQAVVNTGVIVTPVSFTTQVVLQAKGDENSWADVVDTKMQMAENSIGAITNEQFLGPGQSLIAPVTVNSGGASTTITVGTAANFYQLYVGRNVDILTRASGFPIASGQANKITAVDLAAGTITVAAAVTTTTSEGVYLSSGDGTVGSVATSAYLFALQSFGQAVATTGTFEGINKAGAGNQFWKGTDASPAALSDPTISAFDKGERLVKMFSGDLPDFFLCDPAVVDKYSQIITTQAQWKGDSGTLASGFTGVKYRNKVLVPDYDMPANTAYGVHKEDIRIYTLMEGPDWDDEDGSMLKRFARALPVEAWLVWYLQLGFHRCNSQLRIGNLNQAA